MAAPEPMHRKRNIQPSRANAAPAYSFFADAAPTPLPAPRAPERRQHVRHEAAMPAGAEPVRLVDLSTFGCCLKFAGPADYRPGQFIRLGFAGQEMIRAIVRWVEPRRIGAEFTGALGQDRIEAILSGEAQPQVALV